MISVHRSPENHPAAPVDYEPPTIESVLTAASLAREVQYAGIETCDIKQVAGSLTTLDACDDTLR